MSITQSAPKVAPRRQKGFRLWKESPDFPGKNWTDYLVDNRVVISFFLFGGFILSGILQRISPLDVFDFQNPWAMAGVWTALAGLFVRSWAAGTLRKGKSLTTEGPYRLCRNPLYLGSYLIMIGFCLLLNDPIGLVLVLGPMLGIYLLTIRREERRLREKYGEELTNYYRQVPRFFPWKIRFRLEGNWNLAQWSSNREYNAIIGVLLGLGAIKLWLLIFA